MARIRLTLNRGKTKLVKANHERDARLDPRYGFLLAAHATVGNKTGVDVDTVISPAAG